MRHLVVFSALLRAIFFFFLCQLRTVEIEQGALYFCAFFNRLVAITTFFFHHLSLKCFGNSPLMAEAIPQTVQINFNQQIPGVSHLNAAMQIQTTTSIS
ncbi:hypothetical protein HMPREF1620_01888 [Escherichia coli 909945-2]|nr:hypothetical protein HMPREF1620_01888 [Escherichia coli 909945-2]